MGKIIGVIGDTHGFNAIDEIVLKNPEIEQWIFLGDYVDHWTRTNVEIKDNLLKIIEYKKENPNTILLIGNHDNQYIFPMNDRRVACSGFRAEIWYDLHDIFTFNKKLFQMAYQIDKYLFTHAGIHRGWWKYEYPYFPTEDIAKSLNVSYDLEVSCLFDVGYLRGGFKKVGGPFWADKRMTSKKPLMGYHQIVGHTPGNEVKTITIDKKTSITYCNVIPEEKAFYKLEING